MKMNSNRPAVALIETILMPLILLFLGLFSCTREDEPIIIPPDNTVEKRFLFSYRFASSDWSYRSLNLTGSLGEEIASYKKEDRYDGWAVMAGIEVGKAQFVFGHCLGWENPFDKKFEIRKILPDGYRGEVTESGSWEHNYETVFGYKVSSKGFLFGQDSYGDHPWFTQEVTARGELAPNESDHGEWHNFYKAATPIYIKGQTYLFFQTTNDNYWFIVRACWDGVLEQVCDGHWAHFWDAVTSVEVGGNVYLVGCRQLKDLPVTGEYFIQKVNEDGTLGTETDRGAWNNYYTHLVGYAYGGKGYVFGYLKLNSEGGHWFTQEITSDGKMGTETSSGNIDDDYSFFHPYVIRDPGSLRFRIDWDLSKTTGAPTKVGEYFLWNDWTTFTKFGGGAAVARIDKDAQNRYDAVLTGIVELEGVDRFYYKVVWNIDNVGSPKSWSETRYGPYTGHSQQGGGADFADIDGNGIPDLVLMCVDDPDGANEFWYYIGWNMDTNGQVASWSSKIRIGPLPNNEAGGGLALGDIDKNGRPDMVLMGIAETEGNNMFLYMVLQNLNQQGLPQNFPTIIPTPCSLNSESGGGGAALADVNGDGKLDLVLTCIDSPQGANAIWCYIGWGIDINGNVTGWSPRITLPSLYNITCGGGTAVADFNGNGTPDLLLMVIDDPYGKD